MIFETVRLLYEIENTQSKRNEKKIHYFSTIVDYISHEGEFKRIRH